MYTIREPNSQWFSPRFFARLAANFSAMRQHAEKIVCDPDKKLTGESCHAPMGKNFCMIFSFAKAGRLTPANDKNGKIAKKVAHRHCGVRFSYGIPPKTRRTGGLRYTNLRG